MWQTPKTDWKPTDFFNVEDYNRIKGNLEAMREQALVLWPEFAFEKMGEDKTYQDYGFYADEINRFEKNIDLICDGTYHFAVGERKIFYDNQPFIDWNELNRIESACQTIYSNLIGQIAGRQRLVFQIGRRRAPVC